MSDYGYLSVSDGTGDSALMHITSARSVGSTTITVDSVSRVAAQFIGTSGSLLPTGLLNPATVTNFKGHTSGGALQIDGFEPGTPDIGNTIGQVVIIKPNTGWANRVAKFIQNATGYGTPEAITTAGYSQPTGSFAVPAGSIAPAALATGIPFATLLSTIFSGQVTTVANTGTGGGNINYVNLGGIKLLWGITNRLTVGGSSEVGGGVVLPTFFTTVTGGGCSTASFSSTYDLTSGYDTGSPTTSIANVVLITPSPSGGSAQIYYWLIGT